MKESDRILRGLDKHCSEPGCTEFGFIRWGASSYCREHFYKRKAELERKFDRTMNLFLGLIAVLIFLAGALPLFLLYLLFLGGG